MKRSWILGCILALGLPLAACDGGNGDTDAGPGGRDSGPNPNTDAGPPRDGGPNGNDAGPAETGPMVGFGDDLDTLTAANYACRGTRMAPTGGDDVAVTANLAVFGEDYNAEGLTVQFFPDNNVNIDGTCTAPCIEATSNAAGQISVMAPAGGWYGYRIAGGPATAGGMSNVTFLTVAQINEEAPNAAGEVNLSAISQTTRNSIQLVLGTNPVAGTTTVVGVAFDCDDENIANASLRVFDSTGRLATVFNGAGAREFYFNGASFPAFAGRRTNVDGLYGVTNMPVPADGQYRMELWGSLTADGPVEMLGCETVPVAADGVSIVNLGPVRGDGPSGCSGS